MNEAEGALQRATRQGDFREAYGSFIRLLVHDLQNPLTGIRGYADLLLSTSGLTDEERKQMLQDISDQAGRMSEILQDLHYLGKLDTDAHTLPMESMGKLFEAFPKVDSHAEGTGKSTGLGLLIVRRIMELHGGRVRAESSRGKGSTFSFTLPVQVKKA
jgi:signal transduction histidine kinase